MADYGESQVPLIPQQHAHRIPRKSVSRTAQPYRSSLLSSPDNPGFGDVGGSYALSYIPLPTSYQDPQNIPPKPSVSDASPSVQLRSWRPGFWIRFPILGILSLFLNVLCAIAAVVVLLYSNGKPISEWSGNLQPSVLLAYTSTLANVLLGTALSEGLVISFWELAIKGASVPDLHYCWKGGYALWGAVSALWHFRAKTVSLACILTTISCLLRGPLMQRATSVESHALSRSGALQVHIAPTLTDSFGGQVQGRSHSDISFSPNFTAVVQNFQSRELMQMPSTSCVNCMLNVTGFGFGVNCVQTSTPYNLTTPLNVNASNYVAAYSGYDVFYSAVTILPSTTLPSTIDNTGVIGVNITRKDSPACEGTLTNQICSLHPGTVSYSIQMDGNIVTFQSRSWRSDTFLKSTNMTVPNFGANTLGPLQIFGSALFTSSSHLSFGGGVGYVLGNSALLSNIYINASTDCTTYFRDPMDDIIDAYRELAFRMALRAAADDPSINDTVSYTSQITQAIYVVNFTNLAVALLASCLGAFAVMPLFAGWWTLGRKMSMSPLELANAFGGGVGIFGALNGNATAEEIVKRFKNGAGDGGPVRLKYGVVSDTGRLALGDEGIVRRPNKGEHL